ncbi:MAG: FkbM family methyltransferase [Candidatus Taylorbacteria bacterium]|nr:FkbM family methyltransferase [Candidatus Taylorbacteria bacterium]
MIHALRTLYRTYIHSPSLDRALYAFLDASTNLLAYTRGFSFPSNYIRRWKLDMLFGSYEPETTKLFANIIRPGMTVVDIGAHIGYFTRLFSKLAGARGQILAFEADPTNYALLVRNTSRTKNVRCVPLAVTDKKGIVDFYHFDDKSGAHSTIPNIPLPFEKRVLHVPSTSLDGWLDEQGIVAVDVVKMDIEGGESTALCGMTKTLGRARVLVTECAPAWIEAAGSTPLRFLQTIESAGFSIFAVTAKGLIALSPVQDETYRELLPRPKAGSHQSEFINLYCVKK